MKTTQAEEDIRAQFRGGEDEAPNENHGNGKMPHGTRQQTRRERLHPEDGPLTFPGRREAIDWLMTLVNADGRERRLMDLRIDRDARRELATEGWVEPELLGSGDLTVTHPDWLVLDYLERGTVGFLNGAFGSAKSFLAISWACCMATGTRWFGQKTRKARVIYIAAEGQQGIGKRVRAWEIEHNDRQRIDSTGLAVITRPIPLGNDAAVDWLCEQIVKFEADMIFIDTLARSIDGLNENDAVDMAKVISALYRLRDARGENMTSVLVVHHTGWADQTRSRGSSRLPSDTDSVMLMEKNDAGAFRLSGTKSKEDQLPVPRCFTLKPVEVGTGITSCVLQDASGPWEPPAKKGKGTGQGDTDYDAELLAYIREHPGQSSKDIAGGLHRGGTNISSRLTHFRELGVIKDTNPRKNATNWEIS